MTCSHCGYNVAEGAAACPGCGTPANANQGAGAHQGMPGPAGAMGPAGTMGSAAGAMGPPPAAPAAFTFDLSRLSRADQIAGGATLVFLISLFLPWFSVNAGIYSGSCSSRPARSAGASGHSSVWSQRSWPWPRSGCRSCGPGLVADRSDRGAAWGGFVLRLRPRSGF
jgi:hypothetical protein